MQFFQNLEETIKVGAVGRRVGKSSMSLKNKVSAGSQSIDTEKRNKSHCEMPSRLFVTLGAKRSCQKVLEETELKLFEKLETIGC